MMNDTAHYEKHAELCALAAEKMPPEQEIRRLSDFYKVFGDPTRMRILFVLLSSEACVCGLAKALNMTDSAVSHQLRILRDSRLVTSRREGKSVVYSLADDHIRTIVRQGLDHVEE